MNIRLSMKRRTISVSQVVISTSGRPMKFKFSSSISGIRFFKAFVFQSDGSHSYLGSFSNPFERVGGVVLLEYELLLQCDHERVVLVFGTRQRNSYTWCTLAESPKPLSDSKLRHLYAENDAFNSRIDDDSGVCLGNFIHGARVVNLQNVNDIYTYIYICLRLNRA